MFDIGCDIDKTRADEKPTPQRSDIAKKKSRADRSVAQSSVVQYAASCRPQPAAWTLYARASKLRDDVVRENPTARESGDRAESAVPLRRRC